MSGNLLSHSNSFGFEMEKDAAGCRALNRNFIVGGGFMDRKATNIVAYITLVGWLLAYFVGDRYNSRFHLNQALVLNLFFLVLRVVSSVVSWVLGWIPLVGWIVMLAVNVVSLLGLVLWILGLVYAVQDKEQPVPLLGYIHLLR